MPTARDSWGGALASKTHDFAGTPVNRPEKSTPVRTPWAPGAPALAAAARAVDEVVSSGRSAETALAAHEGDAHRAAVSRPAPRARPPDPRIPPRARPRE